jgi:ribosomal protein S6
MKKEIELYEIVLLIKPAFNQQEILDKINYYHLFLTNQGSRVISQNRGKKSLNYMIKGFDNAIYIQMYYLGNGQLVNALNKEFSRDESILRNITTKFHKTIK